MEKKIADSFQEINKSHFNTLNLKMIELLEFFLY